MKTLDETPEAAPAALPEDPQEPPVRVPLALEDVLAALVMAALTLITFANVVARYFTDQSFAWTEEISVFLMIVLTLAGAGAAIARERHIRIETLMGDEGSERRRRLLRFSAGISALFFVVLAVLSVRLVWDNYRYEETSPGIGVPTWWYSIWLPVLSLAIAARAFGAFLRQARGRAGAGRDVGAGGNVDLRDGE